MNTIEVIEVYVDGACSGNPGLAGCGVYLKQKEESIKIGFFLGPATNNIAEYTALLIALNELKDKRDIPIIIYSDSELVVKQVKGEYRVKDVKLKPLYNKVLKSIALFSNLDIKHINREKNKIADALAREVINISRLVG